MPKMKSHSGAKKRFKIGKTGKVKFSRINRGHFLTKKSSDRKRVLRKPGYVEGKMAQNIKKLIQG